MPADKRNAPVLRSRVGVEVWGAYEDRWDLIDRPAMEAPVLLAESVMGLIDEPRIAFPDWHPWHDGPPVPQPAGN